MHMTENNNSNDSKSFLFQGRPSQVFGEPSAPTSATAKVYSVGDVGPGGGIVFYVHPSGTFTSIGSEGGLNCKYLEAAPADLEGEFKWCNIFTQFVPLGVAATGIGAGMANTITAINKCARRRPRRSTTSSAIHAAANYVNNGKTDWHLPSKDELNELYKYAISAPSGDARRNLHPSFSADFYWSSSECYRRWPKWLPVRISATKAWSQYFGYQSRYLKTIASRVRPVRAF
jgi:hypothetical protein